MMAFAKSVKRLPTQPTEEIHGKSLSGGNNYCSGNNFCLAICTNLGVEVEVYSRKQQRLGGGVMVKTGKGGGFVEREKGLLKGTAASVPVILFSH